MRLLPEVVLLASLLAVVLAAVSPAELAVSALALASSSAVLEEQAEMPFRPSSSYFLHWLKASMHFFRWATTYVSSSASLQFLKN